ncbi:MAG: transposase [Gammaproteobacteria bacterium]|nr:transposase [Gammaproteobacteria bacterium]
MVKPAAAFVTGDSWYSSAANLKMIKTIIRDFSLRWKATVRFLWKKANGSGTTFFAIPEDSSLVYLRGFGTVKVFREWLKNQPHHYALYQPNDEDWVAFDRPAFLKLHDQHWQIEQYHRTLKQVCHIEHFQVRQPTAIRNHLFEPPREFRRLVVVSHAALADSVSRQ